jgi:hypothetical protein
LKDDIVAYVETWDQISDRVVIFKNSLVSFVKIIFLHGEILEFP